MKRETNYAGLFLALLACFILLSIPGQGQFPKLPKIPKIPGAEKVKIPGLDRLFNEDPPVTTALTDAVTEVPFLDDYAPRSGAPLIETPRTASGAFTLFPGNFEFEAQSYCLHAGTYAPSKGDGYLFAPLKGPKAFIIKNLLTRSFLNPALPQPNVQVLIWAILARTKINDMPPEMQNTAQILLSADEIKDLNGGALGVIPDSVKERAFGKLPDDARRVYEAENRLRGMLTVANTPYDQLERVAVLNGTSPFGPGSREIPRGRWSYNPGGYFVRYLPTGYPHTHEDVYVPNRFSLERDAQSRITRLSDAAGSRLQIAYDDSVPAGTIEGDSGVRAYAFRSVRYYEGRGALKEAELRKEWGAGGWTLVGLPSLTGKVNPSSAIFTGLGERYSAARSHRQEFQTQAEHAAGKGPVPGEAGMRDVMDVANLRVALKASMGSADDADADAYEYVTNAWQSTFAAAVKPPVAMVSDLLGAPVAWPEAVAPPTSGFVYDPAGTVAVPGDTSRQRLAQSARCKLEGAAAQDNSDLRAALAGALRKHGAPSATPDDLWVVEEEGSGGNLYRWGFRLGRGNRLLGSIPCLRQQEAAGTLPAGGVEGSLHMVVGMIQHAGDATRVTARVVDVETAVVLDAGKGTVTGTDPNAVGQGADQALGNMGLTLTE
jgi:hypothetical protein